MSLRLRDIYYMDLLSSLVVLCPERIDGETQACCVQTLMETGREGEGSCNPDKAVYSA